MTQLILVRHGETAWNHYQRLQGQAEVIGQDADVERRQQPDRDKQRPAAHAGVTR